MTVNHRTAFAIGLVVALFANSPREASACPNAPPASVTEVAPGVFVRVGAVAVASPENGNAIANIGFIVGDGAVAVIDTGGSICDGASLRAAIRARTALPIRFVFDTHAHPDHALGNAAFLEDKPEFIAHRRFAAALAARGPYYLDVYKKIVSEERFGATALVPPSRAVEGATTVDLGNRILAVTAFPAAHTDNDLTVLDRATGTLWAGDLVFLEHIPVVDGNLRGWLVALDTMARTPGIARVVPGHGPASAPWPDALEAERRYLTRLLADVRKLVDEGADMRAAKSAAADEAAKWKLADEFHERNANAAFAEEEWE